MNIAAHQRITFHPSHAAAAALAKVNQADDDSAEYVVEQGQSGYFVAVYEDGERVGTL